MRTKTKKINKKKVVAFSSKFLKKTGFRDEVLGLVPDRNQALEATLAPLQVRPDPAAKPPKGAGKLDRILGDRE